MGTSALVEAIRGDQSAIGRSRRRRHSVERVERERVERVVAAARPIIERAVWKIRDDVTGWDPENLVGEVLSALPAWLGQIDETRSDEEIAVYLHRRIVGAVSDAKRKADPLSRRESALFGQAIAYMRSLAGCGGPTAQSEAYRTGYAVFVAAVKGIDTNTLAGRTCVAEAAISAAHTHATQRCVAERTPEWVAKFTDAHLAALVGAGFGGDYHHTSSMVESRYQAVSISAMDPELVANIAIEPSEVSETAEDDTVPEWVVPVPVRVPPAPVTDTPPVEPTVRRDHSYRYPREVRERAVQCVLDEIAETGVRLGVCARVARELNVAAASLRAWVAKALAATEPSEPTETVGEPTEVTGERTEAAGGMTVDEFIELVAPYRRRRSGKPRLRCARRLRHTSLVGRTIRPDVGDNAPPTRVVVADTPRRDTLRTPKFGGSQRAHEISFATRPRTRCSGPIQIMYEDRRRPTEPIRGQPGPSIRSVDPRERRRNTRGDPIRAQAP